MAKAAYIGIDDKARKISKGYIGVPTFIPITLPAGYTQIEYIESTGSQAINTGIIPDINTRVSMSFAMNSAPSSNVAIFGGKGQFAVRWAGNLATPVFRHNLGGKAGDFPSSIAAVGSHEVDKNGASCTLDGEVNVISGVSGITSDSPITFCAFNKDNDLSAFSSILIKSAQIYQNEVLVRDFIPCKNASGVAGLIDIVNNVFYASEGTGQFIAGSDTPQSFAREVTKAYIGVNGVAQLFYKANSFVLPTYTGQYVISGDETKGSIQLLTSGNLTLHPATYDIFCVGGGASGYSKVGESGCGGGSGYTYTKLDQIINTVTKCSVVIGSGGAGTGGWPSSATGQNPGGQSSIVIGSNTYTADGGNNDDGGSGGGKAGASIGKNGGAGGSDGSSTTNGQGQGTTTRAFEESNNTLYSGGGGGGGYIPRSGTAGAGGAGGAGGGGVGGKRGNGWSGMDNTGGGGGGAAGGIGSSSYIGSGPGGSGIVIVRWGY